MNTKNEKPRFKIGFAMIATVVLLVMMALEIFGVLNTGTKYPVVTEAEVVELLNNEDVSVMANGDTFIIKSGEDVVSYTPIDRYDFRDTLFTKGIEVTEGVQREGRTIGDVITKYLILFIVLFIINKILNFSQRISNFSKMISGVQIDANNPGENGNDGNNGPKGFDMSSLTGGKMSLNIRRETPNVKFSDVAGINEVEREMKNIVSFLQNPYKFVGAGARMPKGAILYGKPGTGKTLMAKAIAGEAGVPFLSVSGSDFMEMYVGVGAKRVRELFDTARKCAPCIVFIDEIDAIGGKRGESNSGERDQTINAILTEMDGFSGSEGIFVLAATNRIDMLDEAIKRPGRFDKHIAVPLPDKDARLSILNLHARNKRLDETVDLAVIAAQTTGFAGADLESLLNEATILSVQEGKEFVSKEEIDRAFFKLIMEGDVKDGQGKRRDEELKLVAWHEAGHTLITKLLTTDEVTRVTILASTSGAGGVTFHNPEEGKFFSKKDLRNRIAISYGGRAAEEILFGDHEHVTVGASSDIQHASQQIRDYIMKYGMSDTFGMLDISAFNYQSMSNEQIINEAAKLANDIYKETLDTLKANKDKLEAVANALIEKESLLDKEIDAIMYPERNIEEAEVLSTVEA